ncbi:MAG: hypothetical protein Q4A66_10890 [Eubacteriales bacterium]|nr:hypothetical protein [Eubacteriales bacterium]
MKRGQRLLACVLLLAVLAALSTTACAAAGEVVYADVTFNCTGLDRRETWTFEFRDEWFERDADEYNHDLAQATLGLAFASFRNPDGPKDADILLLLQELHMQDIESFDYNRETSIETIATAMGHKQLPSGDTLLAIGVSGQGYKNEWLSNFDIGTDTEHRGFANASNKVVRRVMEYIERHGLTNVRIWIGGFSRAAAVSNLVGAKLMEAGVVDEKTAFVYTFATPRVTKEPVAYPNIFNVIGKFDPVTKIPFAEWGYDRHGVSFYTPAQETDSDYYKKQQAADEAFFAHSGVHIWNYPVINHHISVICAYLLSNIPTIEYYDLHMRDYVGRAWNERSAKALLSLLDTLMNIQDPETSKMEDNAAHKQRVDEMLNYIVSMALSVISDEHVALDRITQEGHTATAVAMVEHMPSVYFSWMFSSEDPEEIFEENTEYVQLVVQGDADVSIFDQSRAFVLTMDTQGVVSYETDNPEYALRMLPEEERPMILALRADDKSMFILPKDQVFYFTMTPNSDCTLRYYGMCYDIDRSAPTMSSVRELAAEAGEEYLGLSLTDKAREITKASEGIVGDAHRVGMVYDPDELINIIDATQFTDMNTLHVNIRSVIRGAIITAAVILLLVLFVLVLLIVAVVKGVKKIVRKRKARKMNAEQAA